MELCATPKAAEAWKVEEELKTGKPHEIKFKLIEGYRFYYVIESSG